MKINRNNQDLKITNHNRIYNCFSCVFNSPLRIRWCSLFCRSGKVWIKDIFNSDIFRL
jgi:hypothetical protein